MRSFVGNEIRAMNHKTIFLMRGVTSLRRHLLLPIRMVIVATVVALISLSQVSFAASTPAANAAPTAVIINAIARTQNVPMWDKAGALVQTLTTGTKLTVTSRSTDSQWLYGKTDDGMIGWVAADGVIAVNVALSLIHISEPTRPY